MIYIRDYTNKSAMLKELVPMLSGEPPYICITRPRRFGKTVAANMIASFLGNAVDSQDVFERLEIGQDKVDYLRFLKSLLKSKAYVELAYMIGILPIAKYSDGSELNMFMEYDMAKKIKFNEYFGFLDEEVDLLYERYLKNTKKIRITRAELREWYDGYHTASGERVEARMQEYAATAEELNTKDQIYSAMVVYGLLTYEDGEVFIPNKETKEHRCQVEVVE